MRMIKILPKRRKRIVKRKKEIQMIKIRKEVNKTLLISPQKLSN
jgi:hypothetical protein